MPRFKFCGSGAWITPRELRLSDRQWTATALLPRTRPGTRQVDDSRDQRDRAHAEERRRFQTASSLSGQGPQAGMPPARAEAAPGGLKLIDSATARAHRSAAGGNGKPAAKPQAARAAGGAPRFTWPQTGMGACSSSPRPQARWRYPTGARLTRQSAASDRPPADTAYDGNGLGRLLLARHHAYHPEQPNPEEPAAHRRVRLQAPHHRTAQGLASLPTRCAKPAASAHDLTSPETSRAPRS